MKKVTEFELMQALWDCSCYVSDLPTKEEAIAVKNGVSNVLYRWIQQQELSDNEKNELSEKVITPGPLEKAAQKALSKRHPSSTFS